jgi:hypothetical protein
MRVTLLRARAPPAPAPARARAGAIGDPEGSPGSASACPERRTGRPPGAPSACSETALPVSPSGGRGAPPGPRPSAQAQRRCVGLPAPGTATRLARTRSRCGLCRLAAARGAGNAVLIGWAVVRGLVTARAILSHRGAPRWGADRHPGGPGPNPGGTGSRTSRGQPSSLRVSRGSRNGSLSSGWPARICRARSISALNSAPNRITTFEIQSQVRKMITPPRVPYVLL